MWALIYGFSALAVCGISWAAKQAGLQKLSLLLLASCAISNMAYGALHPPLLVAVNAVQDVTFFWMALSVIRNNKDASTLLWPFVLTYVVMFAAHFAFLVSNPKDYVTYYSVLNILFALQLLSVGGFGVRQLAIRLKRGDDCNSLIDRGLHSHKGR